MNKQNKADILIRGMEMPERCDAKCPLYNTGSGYFDCVVTKQYYNWGLPGRPSDCPLVELPEHGDLISLKDAKTVIDRFIGYLDEEMIYRIKYKLNQDCPVVIPASKEETE